MISPALRTLVGCRGTGNRSSEGTNREDVEMKNTTKSERWEKNRNGFGRKIKR